MRLNLQEITESEKQVEFSHVIRLVEKGADKEDWDYRFPEPVWTRVRFHRSGTTLIFSGEVRALAQGHCSRCLEPYRIEIEKPFRLSLIPALQHRGGIRLNVEDLDQGFYAGNDIDLGHLVQEEVILELPIRPLCKEECLGLCSECGGNLNEGGCSCAPESKSPGVLRVR